MQRKISAFPLRHLTPPSPARRRRWWPPVLLALAVALPLAAIAWILIDDPTSPTAGATGLDPLAQAAHRIAAALVNGIASAATHATDLWFRAFDSDGWASELSLGVGGVLCGLAGLFMYRRAQR